MAAPVFFESEGAKLIVASAPKNGAAGVVLRFQMAPGRHWQSLYLPGDVAANIAAAMQKALEPHH